MTAYETVIGLEVHMELATKSKIFCSCNNGSDAEPNTHVCPACCGMPGMLPVANRQVINLGMTAGMMLNCHINRTTTFDKKIVAKVAIESLAKGVVLVHNHPSGCARPSALDIKETDAVKKGLSLFDIQLLDHVIIGEDEYFSFAEDRSFPYKERRAKK